MDLADGILCENVVDELYFSCFAALNYSRTEDACKIEMRSRTII